MISNTLLLLVLSTFYFDRELSRDLEHSLVVKDLESQRAAQGRELELLAREKGADELSSTKRLNAVELTARRLEAERASLREQVKEQADVLDTLRAEEANLRVKVRELTDSGLYLESTVQEMQVRVRDLSGQLATCDEFGSGMQDALTRCEVESSRLGAEMNMSRLGNDCCDSVPMCNLCRMRR